MSVWPSLPGTTATLAGSEGTLVSVSVPVPPRYLEALLEALAQVDFPINPQIYHSAAVEYVYADGRTETEPTTLVEFPAYASRLDQVRAALAAYGFGGDAVHVAEMLTGLRGDAVEEAAPAGAAYVRRVYRRIPAGRAAGAH